MTPATTLDFDPLHSSAAAATPRSMGPARTLLPGALLLGVASDALLRYPWGGVAIPIWFALASLALVAAARRAGRSMPAETGGWLGVAVLLACAIAWREAGLLQFLDFVAAGAALLMAAISLCDPQGGVRAARLRDTIWATVSALLRTILGAAPTIAPMLRELFAPSAARAGGVKALVRVTGIVAVLLIVFGSLLRGADPIFASLVTLPDLDAGEAVAHLLMVGIFTWLGTGWALAALGSTQSAHRPPDVLPFGLGLLDLTAALGTLNLLFATFLLAQLGWLFGGERFLHDRTGLTAAEYARSGFFQMVWVVALVVPLLLVSRAALQPGRALARRHTMLALPLVALLGAMIVSAMLRMRLYVGYYGLTVDRFYPLAFMAWLSVLLLLLATTVLRDRGRRFVAGAMVSGLATLALLNLVSPDRAIARVNLARVSHSPRGSPRTLDLEHLATLSADAVELTVAATLGEGPSTTSTVAGADARVSRCRAARLLLYRWGPGSSAVARTGMGGAWRYLNAGSWRATALVGREARALRRLTRGPCDPPDAPRPPRAPLTRTSPE